MQIKSLTNKGDNLRLVWQTSADAPDKVAELTCKRAADVVLQFGATVHYLMPRCAV